MDIDSGVGLVVLVVGVHAHERPPEPGLLGHLARTWIWLPAVRVEPCVLRAEHALVDVLSEGRLRQRQVVALLWILQYLRHQRSLRIEIEKMWR